MSSPTGVPDDAWLVAIDLQNIFGDPQSPWAAPRFEESVDATLRLAEAFGERCVFTRFVAPQRPSGSWVPYYEEFSFALQPPDANVYRLDDRIATHAGRTVSATTFGKWGTDLAAITGPEPHLVVCGVATDCCVLSTVLPAADAGARVTVVTDACAGSTDEAHQQALAAMALYAPLVGFTTTDKLLTTS
ncbi:cysteine hydrolase family protein [Segeticoccus rhizosphaerae]|uniref:cysteine hydrolase family protein n=1 Tax=Segeticoccus rhizosphaerae TaxID=1104777 RepID=UPI0010BF7F3A|nr:cysteine hydrolase [Ornithinicoccus soli]